MLVLQRLYALTFALFSAKRSEVPYMYSSNRRTCAACTYSDALDCTKLFSLHLIQAKLDYDMLHNVCCLYNHTWPFTSYGSTI